MGWSRRGLAIGAAVALAMFGLATPTHGATRTWTGLGANNNWNTAANWSGNAVPGVNDTAVFDGTSAKPADINVNVNLGGAAGGLIVAAAYTGSITQLPNVTLSVGTLGFSQAGGTFSTGGSGAVTVNGPLTLTGGTFTSAGTGAMTVNGFSQSGGSFVGGSGARTVNGAFSLTGGSFTSTSGTWTVTGNFTQSGGTFDPNGGILRFAGGTATIDVAGSATYGDVTFAAGTKTIAAGNTVIVTGLLTMAGSVVNLGTIAARGPINQAATAGAGTGTIRIDGTLDQTFTGSATAVPGAGALPNLVIDKPSGTLDLVGTIRTGRNWTYTSGTVDAGTSLVVLTGGTLSGAMPFFDLDLRGTVTGVASDTATVDGTLNLVSGAFNLGAIAARGPINQAATAGAGTGTIRIDGTLDQTFTGSATAVPGAGALPNLVIDKPSGTLDLVGTIRTGRNWTYTSGTVDAGTSLVVLTGGTLSGAMPFFDLDLRGTVTGVASDTATVDGTLNLVSGAFNLGAIAARGPINQAATAGAGTGTIRIDGTLDQTFTGSATAVPGAGALPNLVIDKPSGTLDLVGTIRTGRNWTYTSGTVDAGTSLVVLTGGTLQSDGMSFTDLMVTSGTATLGNGLTVDRDLTITGGILDTGAIANAPIDVARDLLVGGTLRGRASTITVEGDVTINGTFTAATSHMVLDGSGGQTLGGTGTLGLFDLTVDDTGGVVLIAPVTVTGVLTLTDGSFDIGGQSLTIFRPIAGAPDNLAADAISTIVANGVVPGIVVPASVPVLGTLRINNPAHVSMVADLTVEVTLDLATGHLDTGSSVVTIGPAGAVVRGTGWVNGRLQKPVTNGTNVAVTFEIGDATAYAPADVVFDNVVIGGLLTGSTTGGDHPALASSPIYPLMSVNRYWTLTNNAIAFGTYDLTLVWVPADVDVGAMTSSFIVGKLDGVIWTTPTIGSPTPTSINATGITGFSDFVVGDPTTADLAITKSASPDPARAGLPLVYTLTISNAGPADAASVSLADVLPVALTGATYCTGSGCDPSGGSAWSSPLDLGTLAAGTTVVVRIGADVPADTAEGTTLGNTASVSSATTELDPSDDTASVSTTVETTADLAITKSASPDPARAGLPLVYTLTISNAGPADAASVSLADVLPVALTGATYCTGSGCDPSGGSAWSSPLDLGTLAAGTTVVVRIGADVPADTAEGTTLGNTASVSSATTELDPSDDTASVSTTVETTADLAITKSGPATTTAGDPAGFDYVLTVTGDGPADNVGEFTVTDHLPAGLTFRPTGSDPRCVAAGQDVTCVESTGLISGGSTSFAIHVSLVQSAAVGSALSNSASVASDGTVDPDPSNDTSAVLVTTVTATAPVPPAPDTAIGSITQAIDASLAWTPAILMLLMIGAGLAAGAYVVRRRPD